MTLDLYIALSRERMEVGDKRPNLRALLVNSPFRPKTKIQFAEFNQASRLKHLAPIDSASICNQQLDSLKLKK